jgi:CRISPR-associated protein Csb2
MLALGIHYLTGYATATATDDYEHAEWPPHPARVFMALAAAHYETEKDPAERAALEWLETLPPPALKASAADRRTIVTHYVPANDRASFPAIRQPRHFPKVRPHEPDVFLIWQTDTPTTTTPSVSERSEQAPPALAPHHAALARLCAKTTRIGHSSSLVQMWLPSTAATPAPNYLPLPSTTTSSTSTSTSSSATSPTAPSLLLRVPTAGFLRHLETSFNEPDIEAFFALKAQIAAAKGTAKTHLKTQFAEKYAIPFTPSAQPPSRLRPSTSTTCAYSSTSPAPSSPVRTIHAPAATPFAPDLLILSKLDGPALGLEATPQLTTALRGTLLKTCASTSAPLPEWLTGHAPDGKPTTHPHIALLPLAFAGDTHADGHLLGLAIAFPRDLTPRERGRTLAPFLYTPAPAATIAAPAIITLTLGRLGVWTLAAETRDASLRPRALRTDTWCGPATDWASVTPVVLERHLKTKCTDPAARFEEITLAIAASCERAGLPPLVNIDADKNAFLSGVPRSKPDKSGFPLLYPDRQQIHVRLRFAEPIEGPVLLGAGRFRGYGLFKPIR